MSAVQDLYMAVYDVEHIEVFQSTPSKFTDEARVAEQAPTYGPWVGAPLPRSLELRWCFGLVELVRARVASAAVVDPLLSPQAQQLAFTSILFRAQEYVVDYRSQADGRRRLPLCSRTAGDAT